MSIIEACILGIVQGATEFLPISSSGHLAILHQWFGDVGDLSISFDVALHVGTLAAVVIYFWSDIVRLVRSLWTPNATTDRRMVYILIIGTIPAVIAGYFFETAIDQIFHSIVSVAILLIIVGVLMWVIERWSRQERSFESISWRDGILIGLAQTVALLPGTSRSGITILTGMTLRLNRAAAARFSFLLALPAIFGAAVKKSFDLGSVTWTTNEILIWCIGVSTAAVTGWIVVRWLLKYLQSRPLYPFVWYRLALGAALLLFFR